ncbi:hypothetical protein J14TS5_59690 [Paenibacillus lautus]|nr:hypothetical protein J14TS5_59690 [Paenibacillus lautus]
MLIYEKVYIKLLIIGNDEEKNIHRNDRYDGGGRGSGRRDVDRIRFHPAGTACGNAVGVRGYRN